MQYRIPFNKPFVVGKELQYVAQCVSSNHLSGDGEFTARCHAFMQERFGAPKVLLTTSCSSALDMAALLLDLTDGDEVILPSYTFSSTANAFLLRGATLKFVDIRIDTLNIDECLIAGAMSERTKAIVPVHYAGVGCEMEVILELARRQGCLVIEDAAQAVDAKYKDQHLGTIGNLAAYSFHETKTLSCGEGGALVINDLKYSNRAEIIREKGTNRSQFFRGLVDKYAWVDIGSSFLPSEITAAFLFAQLENIDLITNRRRQIYEEYYRRLSPLAERGLVSLPRIPATCRSNYAMFHILVENQQVRAALLEHLRQRQIMAVFHYVPLHSSPLGRRLGYKVGMLPVTESVSDRVVRLPFYSSLSEADIDLVVTEVFQFFGVGAGD